MVHNHASHLEDQSDVQRKDLTTNHYCQLHQTVDSLTSVPVDTSHVCGISYQNLTSHDVSSSKSLSSSRKQTNTGSLEGHNLRGHGALRLISRGGYVRGALFIPHYVKTIAGEYFDVILTDTTTDVTPYGGYLLWHAMFIDQTGFGKSFFYAILPNDKMVNFQKAISFMRERVPQTANCKTIIVDHRLAQTKLISRIYPSTRVLICRFSILADLEKHCRLVQCVSSKTKDNLIRWIKELILSPSKQEFEELLTSIAEASPEVMMYIYQTWLPCVNLWSFYACKDALILNSFSENHTERQNKQLRSGLHAGSTLANISDAILRHVKYLDDASQARLSEELSMNCQVPSEFEWLRPILATLTGFARDVVLGHVRRHEILDLSHHEQRATVRCTRCGVVQVTLGPIPKCECTFYKQWMLPCSHLSHVTRFSGCHMRNLTNGRWNMIARTRVLKPVEPDLQQQFQSQPASESKSMLFVEPLTSTSVVNNLLEALNQLNSGQLSQILPQVQKLAEVLRSGPDIQIFCCQNGGNALVPLSSNTSEVVAKCQYYAPA